MGTFKDLVVEVVEKITEDKLIAIICLTALGYWTINKYPINDALPVITGILGGISGFVTGAMKKK